MTLINFVSLVIMAPAMFYGACVIYFLSTGFLYLLFGKITKEEYKDILKKLRLSDAFIQDTKILFWIAYTPLLAVAIIFRTTVLIESELVNFCMIDSTIGYLCIMLFSGYVFPKESRAERNFKKICCEIDLIISDYERTHPRNFLGLYSYYIRKYMNEYKINSRKIYKNYNNNTDFKMIAHDLLIKILYNFVFFKNGGENAMKCACVFFTHVTTLSIKNNYMKELDATRYLFELKKALHTRKDE